MSIKTKIIGLAIALLSLLGAALGVSLYLEKGVIDEIGGITEYHLPLLDAVAEIDVITFEYELVLSRLLELEQIDPESLAAATKRTGEIRDRMSLALTNIEQLISDGMADKRNDLADRLLLAQLSGKVDFLERDVKPFVQIGAEVLDALDQGQTDRARKLIRGFFPFKKVFGVYLAEIRNAAARLVEQSTEDTYRKQLGLRRFSIVIFVITALIGLGMSILIAGRLVSALRKLLAGTKAIERGEPMTALAVVSTDEAGQLTRAFNIMAEELRTKEHIKDTFGKYIDPRIVADLIGGKGESLERAERRVVTVFFSDIANFSGISEQLTASVIARLLNRYFTLAGEVIRSKNGVIDKYIGDSIMAFWTPPFSQGDAHAADACLSALGQRQAVEKVRSELPEILGLRRDLPKFRVRMGLDTGEAVLGTIGSPKAMSYTVIGDTVNLASRLEGVNKVYGTDIIVSETTFRLAQAVVEARELDVVNVVGKQEPQRIYELVAHAGQISDWQGRLHEAYAEALSAYRQQDWAAAEHHLDMALQSAPEDGPSLVLRERVRKLRTSPPRTEWDGVWHLVSK